MMRNYILELTLFWMKNDFLGLILWMKTRTTIPLDLFCEIHYVHTLFCYSNWIDLVKLVRAGGCQYVH